jgi:hypothetical protein
MRWNFDMTAKYSVRVSKSLGLAMTPERSEKGRQPCTAGSSKHSVWLVDQHVVDECGLNA